MIQNLSTKERDLMKTGFYARTKGEELKCPGLEFLVLQEIEDVTARVRATEKPELDPAAAAEAREKFIASLEKECSEQTGLRCSVVSLYAGGLYHLYKYKVYTDVRLVFAPEYAIAFFGGDPDNFTYPRYDLDICFFRVYENDKPLQTPHYLKWSSKGVKEGDVVFVSGNPGSTGRLLTLSQLEFLRDVSSPFTISAYTRRRALLQEYSNKGPEQTRIALRTLFGIENSLKAQTGYQSGLLDKKLMEKKAREEQAFREALKKAPAMEHEFAKAWDEIAEAQKKYAAFYKLLSYFERGFGFNTNYFGIARNLVRLAAEKQKLNAERLREFWDSNLPSIERSLLSPAPIYDDFEIVKLADSLAQLKEELGNMWEVKWILGERSPQAADSIGGNSGSPVVNRKGEVVGVLFDGNIQSLPNNFVYTEEIARSVMVHGQGIIEALLRVYGATSLVNEILGKK